MENNSHIFQGISHTWYNCGIIVINSIISIEWLRRKWSKRARERRFKIQGRFPCSVCRVSCPLQPFTLAAVTTKLLFVDTDGSLYGRPTHHRVGEFSFRLLGVASASLRQPSFSMCPLSSCPSLVSSHLVSSRLLSSHPVPSRFVSADDVRKRYSFRRGTCGGSWMRASCRQKESTLYYVGLEAFRSRRPMNSVYSSLVQL